jgi:hypothetical protein
MFAKGRFFIALPGVSKRCWFLRFGRKHGKPSVFRPTRIPRIPAEDHPKNNKLKNAANKRKQKKHSV